MGDEKHRVVYNYLRNIAKRKKFSKIILIGDLNLNQVSWPEGVTTCKKQSNFLDTFGDLNFDQLIEKSTHINDKILDVLLTNCPDLISNIDIKQENEICKSDHFAIEFDIDIKISRKKSTKRKIYNFKKANLEKLNESLRYVNWNHLLKFCDANTAWHRFKTKLLQLCDIHIPTITIKSDFQPPWFDSDTYKLCRKKERLRAGYKIARDPVHYHKYSQCRKNLKLLIQEKMRSNLNNVEDDPALVSKKCWSHVKATSNSTRIPESVSYNVCFRNNINEQT